MAGNSSSTSLGRDCRGGTPVQSLVPARTPRTPSLKCHHVPSSGGCDGALRAERTLNHSQPPGALDRHVVSLLKGSPKEARLACSSAVKTAVLVQRVAFTKSQWIRPDGNSSTMAKRRLGDTRVHYIH